MFGLNPDLARSPCNSFVNFFRVRCEPALNLNSGPSPAFGLSLRTLRNHDSRGEDGIGPSGGLVLEHELSGCRRPLCKLTI